MKTTLNVSLYGIDSTCDYYNLSYDNFTQLHTCTFMLCRTIDE